MHPNGLPAAFLFHDFSSWALQYRQILQWMGNTFLHVSWCEFKSVSSSVYISARGPLVTGVDLSALLANRNYSKQILNLWSSFVNVNREKSAVAGVNFGVCNASKKKKSVCTIATSSFVILKQFLMFKKTNLSHFTLKDHCDCEKGNMRHRTFVQLWDWIREPAP